MDILKNFINLPADLGVFIVGMFGVVFLSMALTGTLLNKATSAHFTAIETLALGMSGWLIPVLFWAIISQLFRVSVFIHLAVLAVGLCFIFLTLPKGRGMKISAAVILLAAIFIFFTGINLAYISQLTFPAYFDSAEHYRIIKSLLRNDAVSYHWPAPAYYHIGYHLILTAILNLTGAGIVSGMLASAQVALSFLALSQFFIIKRETTSNPAAFFTILLAAFGWYMPTYAINWGKFPSIFGLIGSVFVFNMIYLILKKDTDRFMARRLFPFLLAAIVVAGIIHTRSLIVCGLFAVAILSAARWETFATGIRRLIFGVFFFACLVGGIYLRQDATFASLITPYVKNDLSTMILVILLGIFSVWKFPKLTFILLLFTSMTIFSLYIPLHGLPGYPNLFLLDRPYVQILLHIPFSLIGGLGFAGLLDAIGSRMIVRLAFQLATFGLLAVNAIFYREYEPSSCCQLAGMDDAAAFSWMQEALPAKARVLIASQSLFLTPDRSLPTTAGSDAGVWVSPITEMRTIFFSFNADFALPESHAQICNLRADYIYVGNRRESFKENGLTSRPQWYQGIFLLPTAKIYRVAGC